MNNSIQCSLESSTTKMDLNSASDGIYLIPDLEGLAGLPEIRTTSGVNAGYDGGWTSAQNYDARLISIRGVIANPDVAQVEALRRKLASLVGQGHKEQLTLRIVTEAGNAYAISVRTISCEMALQRVLTKQEFLIQLRADDPLIYDDGASGGTEAILHVQQALGGFEINFELPLAIGGDDGYVTVENGDEMVYPIIELTGALHSPTIVNITTNQQMQILADLAGGGQWGDPLVLSGYTISIDDCVEDAPMNLLQVIGNATQQTYSGKNLFSGNIAQFDNTGGSGTTYTYFRVPSDENYTLTLIAKNDIGAQSPAKFIGLTANGGNATNGYTWAWSGSTQTATKGWSVSISTQAGGNNYYCVSMYPKTDETLQWFMSNFKIQLEKGTATDYEPYVGGVPAPSPSYPQTINTVHGTQTLTINDGGGNSKTVTIDLESKNLFDGVLEDGLIQGTTGINLDNSNFSRCKGYIPVQPSTTYIFSSADYSGTWYIYEYQADGTYNLSNNKTTSTGAITTNAGTYYMRFRLAENNNNAKIQMELGNTATTFQQFIPELVKVTTSQDYIWNDNGTWKIHKEIDKIAPYLGETVSTDYISTTGQLSTGAIVYYTMTTATETAITDATLISQLETVSQLYEGENNISLVPSSGAQGELEIQYMSKYYDNADHIVIDSQARTITLNGQDAYHLKADGSEFITLAPGDNTMYLSSAQTSDGGYAEVKFKQGHLTI